MLNGAGADTLAEAAASAALAGPLVCDEPGDGSGEIDALLRGLRGLTLMDLEEPQAAASPPAGGLGEAKLLPLAPINWGRRLWGELLLLLLSL